MPFKRVWDKSCPRVWDQWEEAGVKWTIQDLPPEDDELAVALMMEYFLRDETLCSSLGVISNPLNVKDSKKFWSSAVAHRTSLACYREEGGLKTLAAVNICPVKCVDDPHDDDEMEGKEWSQVISVLIYIVDKCDVFKTLGVDKYLSGAGLCVTRESRGHGLGTKILQARDKLCASIGIPATSTIFTGPASQKSAARAGFTNLLDVTWAELAGVGLPYPADETRVLKLMVKKYV